MLNWHFLSETKTNFKLPDNTKDSVKVLKIGDLLLE